MAKEPTPPPRRPGEAQQSNGHQTRHAAETPNWRQTSSAAAAAAEEEVE